MSEGCREPLSLISCVISALLPRRPWIQAWLLSRGKGTVEHKTQDGEGSVPWRALEEDEQIERETLTEIRKEAQPVGEGEKRKRGRGRSGEKEEGEGEGKGI